MCNKMFWSKHRIRNAIWASAFSSAALFSLIAISTSTLHAQAAATARIPRLPDGKPNFNGVWQAVNTANWDLETHAASAGPPALGALLAVPPGMGVVDGGGAIPYTPAALKTRDENRAKRWTDDPDIKCYLPGVPRATYEPHPFQMIQSSGSTANPGPMLIAYQYAEAVRTVNMGKPTEAPVDSWMGWSNGRWEADTLVIDVKGFNDQSWLDRSGNFHSDALHVVERYTLVSADRINYEATLEDANVFSRPWKITMPLYRRMEKDARLMEFKCAEFTEELLYGHLRKDPKSK